MFSQSEQLFACVSQMKELHMQHFPTTHSCRSTSNSFVRSLHVHPTESMSRQGRHGSMRSRHASNDAFERQEAMPRRERCLT